MGSERADLRTRFECLVDLGFIIKPGEPHALLYCCIHLGGRSPQLEQEPLHMVAHPADVEHEGKLARYAGMRKYFGAGRVLDSADQTHVVQMMVGKDDLIDIGQCNAYLLKSGNKSLKGLQCVGPCIKKGHGRPHKEIDICGPHRENGRRGNRM